MSTLVLLEAKVKRGAIPALTEFLRKVLGDTRTFDGCLDIEIHFNEQESSTVFVEHWESRRHFEEYVQWRQKTGLLSQLTDHFEDGASTIRYFDHAKT